MKYLLIILFLLKSFQAVAQDSVESSPHIPGLGLILIKDLGRCSASIFAVGKYNKKQKALLLTAGHCVNEGSAELKMSHGTLSMPGNYEKVRETPIKPNMQFYVSLPDNNYYSIQAEKLIFASLYGKDIAIYQLAYTYEELESAGVKPLIVNDQELSVDENLVVYSSVWQTKFQCTFTGYVNTTLEMYLVGKHVLRLNDCIEEAKHGASGSPVLDKHGYLRGILVTVNEAGESCTFDNTCELQNRPSSKIEIRAGSTYATSLDGLANCVDEKGNFNTKLDTCAF